MAMTHLLFTEQYEITDGDIKKEFTIEIFEGTTFRKTQYRQYSRVVEVKAFRITAKEVRSWGHFDFMNEFHDFGYITSRSGEFAHALRRMKQECASLEEMRILIADLEVGFRTALNKDAKRELKRQLGVHKTTSPVVRTNKRYEPLSQIKLPWDEEK